MEGSKEKEGGGGGMWRWCMKQGWVGKEMEKMRGRR